MYFGELGIAYYSSYDEREVSIETIGTRNSSSIIHFPVCQFCDVDPSSALTLNINRLNRQMPISLSILFIYRLFIYRLFSSPTINFSNVIKRRLISFRFFFVLVNGFFHSLNYDALNDQQSTSHKGSLSNVVNNPIHAVYYFIVSSQISHRSIESQLKRLKKNFKG
jgi:hypothetical protein